MVKILGVEFHLAKHPVHWLLCNNEVWKQHKEFDLYWISSWGRIKTFSNIKGWKIKATEITNRGYERTLFCTNNKRKHASIHRITAEYFLPKSHTTETVNHKNFNKLYNRIGNLEWNTQLQNIQHSSRANRNFKKPVIQKSLTGEFIKEWSSAYAAELETGFFGTLISRCCLGKQKQHKQYKWEFKNG